ncbi:MULTISPECIES: hypothetical protein [Pseudomonas]|uniref:hypothetical protein n=1 Tax=Pseudomonas TaxID=286 RepID=UPI0018AB71A1|nr:MULTISPECIES: hypothetical protein [Pseudomonas]MBF8768103.1 hypothetical protein [Pseudomonas putida]MBH3346385.1 hypothetical protein [Pseudomonas parafulva]
MKLLQSTNKTLLLWGLLDAFHIIWYSAKAFSAGRIPYVSDFTSTMALGSELGSANIAMAIASWALQLSIVLTALLFLRGYRPARYLGLAQIPLRLLFVYPSVSLLLIGGGLWSGYPIILMVLLLISEAIKGWTLWKHA